MNRNRSQYSEYYIIMQITGLYVYQIEPSIIHKHHHNIEPLNLHICIFINNSVANLDLISELDTQWMKSSDKLLNRYRINMKQLYIICILLLVLSPIKSTFVDLTHISDKDTIRYPFYKALNMTIEHRGIYTVSDGTETW